MVKRRSKRRSKASKRMMKRTFAGRTRRRSRRRSKRRTHRGGAKDDPGGIKGPSTPASLSPTDAAALRDQEHFHRFVRSQADQAAMEKKRQAADREARDYARMHKGSLHAEKGPLAHTFAHRPRRPGGGGAAGGYGSVVVTKRGPLGEL